MISTRDKYLSQDWMIETRLMNNHNKRSILDFFKKNEQLQYKYIHGIFQLQHAQMQIAVKL